jgi:hypothetical protein
MTWADITKFPPPRSIQIRSETQGNSLSKKRITFAFSNNFFVYPFTTVRFSIFSPDASSIGRVLQILAFAQNIGGQQYAEFIFRLKRRIVLIGLVPVARGAESPGIASRVFGFAGHARELL